MISTNIPGMIYADVVTHTVFSGSQQAADLVSYYSPLKPCQMQKNNQNNQKSLLDVSE